MYAIANLKKTDLKAFFTANGERILFFAAMFMLVLDALFKTSMVRYDSAVSSVISLAALLLIIAKLLIYSRKNILKLLLSFAAIALANLISNNSVHDTPLYIILIIVGADNIPFKDIAKFYFYVASIFVGIIFASSLLGLVTNLVYTEGPIVRIAFGIIYPTDFSAHIFFIMASYAAAYEKTLNYYNCIGGIVVCIFIYIFCHTRADCICITLLWLGIAVIKFIENKKVQPEGKLYNSIKNILRYMCIWSAPIGTVIMLLLSGFYDPSNKIFAYLNDLLSTRLELGKRGLSEYAVTLFGQYVPMVGNGGSTMVRENYFFLDCSYISMLLIYGFVFAMFFIIAFVLIGMKYRNNGIMLWLLALIALNSMIEQHLPECAYCIFAAALTAEGGAPLFNDLELKNNKFISKLRKSK